MGLSGATGVSKVLSPISCEDAQPSMFFDNVLVKIHIKLSGLGLCCEFKS